MQYRYCILLGLLFYVKLSNGYQNFNSNVGRSYRDSVADKIDLSDLTEDEMRALLSNLMERRSKLRAEQKEQCSFKSTEGSIIRTTDSLNNGAIFVGAPVSANTAEKCKAECCQAKNVTCDFAVYQTSETNSGNQPQCYLFHCFDEKSGKSVCSTSNHADYISFQKEVPTTKAVDDSENQLLNTVNSINRNNIKPTSEMLSTTSTTKMTTIPTTTETTTTTTTTPTTTLSTITTTKVPVTTTVKKTTTTTTNAKVKQPEPTKKLEEQTDKPDLSSIPICLKPSETGVCKAYFARYFFDPESNSCKTFTYGGCGGNENNFKTLDDCEEFCRDFFKGVDDNDESVILPLALGLVVTISVLFMVACRLRIMKKKLKRRGKPLAMEESDYLINGMYL